MSVDDLILRELVLAARRVMQGARETAPSVGVASRQNGGRTPTPSDSPPLPTTSAEDQQSAPTGDVGNALRANPDGLIVELGKQLDEQAASDKRLCYGVLGLMGLTVLIVLVLVAIAVLSKSDTAYIPAIAAVTTTVLGAISAYVIKPQQLLDRMDVSRHAVTKFMGAHLIYATAKQDCLNIHRNQSEIGQCVRQAAEEFVRQVLPST